MRIVSPGTIVPEISEGWRRARLARLICITIVVGWALIPLIAVLGGAAPGRNAWLLAGVGALTGVTWAARRWDRQSDRALRILMVAASLEAAAATLAFDRGDVVAGPVFALLLAPAAGLMGPGLGRLIGPVGVLAGGQLLAAAFGPDRGPDAVTAGIAVAAATVVIAATTCAVAASRARSQRRRRLAGDARTLHERLTEALAADPERLALLTLDLDGLDGLDGARLDDLQAALAGEVRGQDIVARSSADGFSILTETDGPGAEALARRIQAAVSAYHRDEIGALNASIGIAVYPEDGRRPEDLLVSLESSLGERAPRLRVVAPATR